jgi:hypothetical protein
MVKGKKQSAKVAATKGGRGKAGERGGAREKSTWRKTVTAFLRAAASHKKSLAQRSVPIAAEMAVAGPAAPPTQPTGSCTIQPPMSGVEGRCVDGVTKDFCDQMGVQFHVKANFKSGGTCPSG